MLSLVYKSKFVNSEPERVDEILYEVQDKILTWAETEAGTLTDSQTVLNAPQEIRHIMTEKQFLNQVREERLANLLSSEINDAEPLWLDYEYEETQVKLDLADMVLQELCFETIREVNRIENRFNNKDDEIDKEIDRLFDDDLPNAETPIILQKDSSITHGPIKLIGSELKI